MKKAMLLLAGAALAAASPIAAQDRPLPRFVTQGGKHSLLVDGAPFLMLGAQANNSSNWPSQLPKVWPVIRQMSANTLEIPVAWEQLEPREGQFDFSYVDTLLKQARDNDVRLVLLWFGTWKNTGPSYAPDWVKLDNRRFPRMIGPNGKNHYVLSPHGRSTLEADKKAFVQLMQHLKLADPQNTVIMVQVENEIGSYRLTRDHSPEAEKLFRGPVPAEVLRKTGKSGRNWSEAFGDFADQAFTSWAMAHYVDEIAAAGKAVKALPMYCNASLGDPFNAKAASTTATGGPQWNMIDVWKAAAPHVDAVAPDIYNRDPKAWEAYLGHYARPDNALMVPELGNSADYARYFWTALGHGAVGFAPFGMDTTGYVNYPLGAKELDASTIESFATKYRLFHPIARQWAAIAANNPIWGGAKDADGAEQSKVMGRWRVTAQYGQWQFGEPEWTSSADPVSWKDKPVGGFVVAQTGPDEFIVAGSEVRVRFASAGAENGMLVRVEEGTLDPNGRWTTSRIWNGDQTDYGLNFTDRPVLLRVTMGTYR